jgi:hypothetical protein
MCVDGPCKGRSLQPIAIAVLDGDICVTGVTLAEDDEDDDDEVVGTCTDEEVR